MTTTDLIVAGTAVLIADVDGAEHSVNALSGVETEGHSFPVIWVERPLSSGGFDRFPWPAESVRAA